MAQLVRQPSFEKKKHTRTMARDGACRACKCTCVSCGSTYRTTYRGKHPRCRGCAASAGGTGTTQAQAPAPPSAALLCAFVAALHDYEPGLVAMVAAVIDAQTTCRFTHLRAGGRFVGVSQGGRRVTHARARSGKDEYAIATPALGNCGGCVGVVVHEGGRHGTTIGVIGTTEPGGNKGGSSCLQDSFDHGTAHGWDGGGYGGMVYLAGQWSQYHGGWPADGWKAGDTAALMLDTAAGTLTLKHRRLGRAFTIGLPGGTRREPSVLCRPNLGPVRLSPLICACASWGVRVDGQTKSRKMPTRKASPL